MKLQAIGVVEINFFTNAIIALDLMCKTSGVELAGLWKTLGGRMIHLVVSGTTSEVDAAVEAVKDSASLFTEDALKVAVTISNPHMEIQKLLNMIEQKTKQ